MQLQTRINCHYFRRMNVGPNFFQTRMGQKYYEHDVPRIADALERIANALEKQNEFEQQNQAVTKGDEK